MLGPRVGQSPTFGEAGDGSGRRVLASDLNTRSVRIADAFVELGTPLKVVLEICGHASQATNEASTPGAAHRAAIEALGGPSPGTYGPAAMPRARNFA